MTAPDVVILGVDWQMRALVRAQLIEQGYEVVATDSWPTMVGAFRPGLPRCAIVDLKNLPDASQVLDELAAFMPPPRVLVLCAAGAMNPDDVKRRGYRVMTRPTDIKHIVAAAAAIAER